MTEPTGLTKEDMGECHEKIIFLIPTCQILAVITVLFWVHVQCSIFQKFLGVMCSLVLTIIMMCLPEFELIIIMLVLEIIGICLFLLWKLKTHYTWPTNLKQPLMSKGLWSYSRQVTIETQNIEKTLNSGFKFLEKLSTQLSNKGINLSTKEAEMFSSNMLMVFCPVVSRIGTDIKAALEGIPTEKRVILVVMHHTPNPKLVISDSRMHVYKPNILETVDCLFHEQHGFYDCNTNIQAIQSVSGALEKVSGE